ncbi:MAG: twin-arginine translocation signal domain-containing protein, partial [Rhodospirillales bacterium]|nr:twin-arginine translocation signal domain-containing protein [Rhodospirillales bacterium]
MKRREFIKGAALTGVATAAAASSLAKPAIAQGKRELKMVTTWPKNFPGLGTGAQRFADRVTNATDGRLTVKLYAAGELVPPFESFSAVSSGTADMYHGADYYWQGKSKA